MAVRLDLCNVSANPNQPRALTFSTGKIGTLTTAALVNVYISFGITQAFGNHLDCSLVKAIRRGLEKLVGLLAINAVLVSVFVSCSVFLLLSI